MKINITDKYNYNTYNTLYDKLNHNYNRYETLKDEYYDAATDEAIDNLHKIIFNELMDAEFISAIYQLNKMEKIISAFDAIVYSNY
jgi:hypothetical protein